MTTLTNIQFIKNKTGVTEYAIVPFDIFQALINGNKHLKLEEKTIPHEVAEKMGISQAAYSQMETAKKNRKATLQKIAEAMNIDYLQLRI